MKFAQGFSKISPQLSRNQWLVYLLIFLIAFLFFFYLQYDPTLADPDSFYHAKMALLIKDQGIIKDFPWLQYTILKDYYTDQHFLYHILLIPFVSFLNPLVGLKLATVILASLLIVVFYWFFRKMEVRWPVFFCLLLLLINPFTFRISLAKAPSLSIIILTLGLYLIFNYRYRLLLPLAFIFVWAYGGFPLLLVFSATFVAVSIIFRFWKKVPKFDYKKIFKNPSLKVFFSSLIGLGMGVIINPYFPKNLNFYEHQFIKIGIINYQKIIGVGGEWYPWKFIELVSGTVFLSIILLIVLVLFFIYFKKQSPKSWTLLILTIFFFLLSLKSRRYVEYYVPIGTLFSAISLTDSLRGINLKKIFHQGLEFYQKRKILVLTVLLYFLISLPYIAIRDILHDKQDLKRGLPYNKFEAASSWLEKNTPSNSIVLHSDWDEFPILFYYNTHNYYIVGLDATFMYKYNKDLYWKWVRITTGQERDYLYKIVRDDFRASYVFLEKDHIAMDQNLRNNQKFDLVYEDKETKIYQVE